MSLLTKLFGKKQTEIRNCHHEDFAHLVEPAFIGAGVYSPNTQYYRFKGTSELDMIAGRYNIGQKYLIELSMRMTSEDLIFYIDQIEQHLGGNEIGMKQIQAVFKETQLFQTLSNLTGCLRPLRKPF